MTEHQIIAASILTAIILIETLFPFRIYIGRLKHYSKNAVFSLINGLFTGVSSSMMSVCAFTMIEQNQLGLLNQLQLPALTSTIAAFLFFDLWIYAWHRANHVIPFLWRFHQIHHNDIEMDMSTALRFHPGEILMASAFNVVIFFMIGISIEQIIIYKGIFHANVMLQHSNINIPKSMDKLLRLGIVTPNTHRVHHSIKQEETDSNFSSVLTVWDRIFGTYRESDPDQIIFGLEKDRTEDCQSIPYLLKLPFKQLQSINVARTKAMINEGNVILIDVRKESDFQQSHINGAVSVRGDKIKEFIANTDRSKNIICYCYKGISSKGICSKLSRAGFRHVYNLKGGYDNWSKNKGSE